MKIIIDGFGGDNAPNCIIEGAVEALKKYEDLSIAVTGKTEILKGLLAPIYTGDRIEIIEAPDVIDYSLEPTTAIRTQLNSSMVVALNKLKEDAGCGAMISAGNSGALLTGAFLKVGRIKGVSRPALCPILPTIKKDSYAALIDCGANVECKPINLLHFAQMGSAYMKAVFNVKSPRVGLLSNGTEKGKGTFLNNEAYPLLEQSGLNFVGNIEAREILSGDIDVIVSDGFSGNIALKSLEGMGSAIFAILKESIKNGGLRAKLGYLLLKNSLREVKHTMDYSSVGGAPFLGVEKIVIKAHGSSKANAIEAAIGQAVKMIKGNLNESLKNTYLANAADNTKNADTAKSE